MSEGRRIPSAVATAPGILSESITLVLAAPSARPTGMCEAKRLTSFPDAFTFEGSFHEQWARIGNCVPPLFMRAIAEHLRAEILAA